MSTNLLNNWIISYFPNVFSKEKEKDIYLLQLVEEVKSELYKYQIEKIRKAVDKDEKNKLKTKLPAVSISAKMKSGHKVSDIIEHTGLIQVDIDELKENEIGGYIEKLKQDQYTFILFKSPSGRPKLIVKIPKELHNHKHYFEGLSEYYLKRYNLKVDQSCKDPSRLMFLSHDPDIYVNDNSVLFNKINYSTKKEAKPDDRVKSDAIKLIEQIEKDGIDITSEYKDWIDVIFALIEIFGVEADEYVHRVSRFYHAYRFTETQDQIESCRKSKGAGITKNSFFHIAKKYINSNHKSKEEKTSKRDKFSITEDYLIRYYDIRYNIVSNDIEFKRINSSKFEVLNENTLYIELYKKGINISLNNLLVLLRSDFVKKHDPFENYFKILPKWNGQDYILKLCSYVKVKDQELFNYHFKKWLVRLVATALEYHFFNKQMLVFIDQNQNNGKSTFSRFLCPPSLNKYIAENISLDKDSRILLARSILINMDELDTFDKVGINALKALFSKEQINERLPYDRKNTVMPRKCSFVGNTNKTEFLQDESGSVRWLCFEVESIDWDYSKKVNVDLVYAQAYALYKSGTFNYNMTREDIEINEQRNKKFYVRTYEMELVSKYFETDEAELPQNFITPSEVLEIIEGKEKKKLKTNNVKIGKAIKALGNKKFKPSDNYGYYLKMKT
ncbi:MAG TPA: hypothetical protein DCG75_15440 [Bacteroidales bacterium]|nr:hypothetical protein [Bacteroidales bacterium]